MPASVSNPAIEELIKQNPTCERCGGNNTFENDYGWETHCGACGHIKLLEPVNLKNHTTIFAPLGQSSSFMCDCKIAFRSITRSNFNFISENF